MLTVVNKFLPAFLLATLLLGVPPARACQVPVFRYALERWRPAAFEVVVFHRGALAPADAARIAALSPAPATANVRVTTHDVNKPMEDHLRKQWGGHGDADLPWAVVASPDDDQPEPSIPIWSGRLDSPQLAHLLDSPARRTTASRLLAGDSAVWVLVEGGDGLKDAAAVAALGRELKKLEAGIKLPRPDPNDPSGEPVLSDLPLRLAFPVVRVDRRDPAETLFVSLLLHGDKEVLASREPVVVPVFGRGRALASLAGKDLSDDRIEEAGVFIAGACSCQVKDLNPGYDLLMAADWDSILRVPPPPESRGRPVVVAPATRPAEEPRLVAAADLTPPGALPAPTAASPLRRRLLTAAVAVMTGVVLFLGWMAFRPNPSSKGAS